MIQDELSLSKLCTRTGEDIVHIFVEITDFTEIEYNILCNFDDKIFPEFQIELIKVAQTYHDLRARLAVKVFEMLQRARHNEDISKERRKMLSSLREMGEQGWMEYIKRNS